VARRESRIATIPVGYADGYGRHFGNWNLEGLRAPAGGTGDTEVLVRGRRARVAGTVCMDSCMVDVTDVPAAEVGDEVVLLGAQDGERIDAEELARRAGTISYEILCAIGARVPRRHVGGVA
jgi:alanine racemase